MFIFMLTIKLLKTIFKMTWKTIEGAGTLMAGAAMLTTATVMNAETLVENSEKKEKHTEKALMKDEISDIINRKYKILDENDGFRVLADTDDFDEAIEWVTEYRMNGRKVKIQKD